MLDRMKSVLKFLVTYPSWPITIPLAILIALLWFLVCPLAILSRLDAFVGTTFLIGVGGVAELLLYKKDAVFIHLYRTARPLSKWRPYVVSLMVFYLGALLLDAFLVYRFYYPSGSKGPGLLITDINDVGGRDLSSPLRDELARQLRDDSCGLTVHPTYISTPLGIYLNHRWVEHAVGYSQGGVFVYGQPFRKAERICSGWVPDNESLEIDNPAGTPIQLYSEWSGANWTTVFDSPYCNVVTGDPNSADVTDEIIWKIHILSALDESKRGHATSAATIAAHGAQGGRGKRRFRAIMSSMVAGLVLYDAGEKLIHEHPCDAKELLGSSVAHLREAVEFNTQVEKEIGQQAAIEPGGRFLYDYANMYRAKLTLYSAMDDWSTVAKGCER
jgi:hypothetical protein